MFAAMSVQWTVARAVGTGLVKDHLPFVRTDKGGKRRSTDFPAFWEAVIAGLLIVGAIVLIETNIKEVREIYIFAVVLVIQSLPFIAAVLIALFERSSLNDFATWRELEARFAELLRRRPALAEVAGARPGAGTARTGAVASPSPRARQAGCIARDANRAEALRYISNFAVNPPPIPPGHDELVRTRGARYFASAVSTSFTQYDVPNGMASSLKLYSG